MKWFYDQKPKDYAMAALLGAVGGIAVALAFALFG